MKNKKGFTLIELIAVIVILGLIMIMVFPSISRLMMSNSKKKYTTYEDLLKEAAEKFARTRMADLGGVTGEGCIDDITIEDLEDANLIKPLGEEDVTCGLPINFDLSEYRNIDASKDYVAIRVRNNKGKVKVELSLLCINKKNKVVYKDLVDQKESGACEKYESEASSVLLNALKDRVTLSGTAIAQTDDNETYYYNNNENYVAYSGILWRIVSYNVVTRTIKLVASEDIALLNYDNASINFRGSNVDNWLNEEFIKYLRDYPQFLEESSWNYTRIDTPGTKPPETDVVQRYVGLLNLYEAIKNESVNSTRKAYTLSKATGNQVWTRNVGANEATDPKNFYAIRPSIVLRMNVPYIAGGAGTSSNPYKIVGEQLNAINPKLDSRFIGEYVKFNENASVFRIVGKTGTYIKLAYDGVLPPTTFDTNYVDLYTAGTDVGVKNIEWFNSFYNTLEDTNKELFTNGVYDPEGLIPEEEKFILGDFCTSVVTEETNYQTTCQTEDVRSLKVGMMKVGDIFAVPEAGGNYWTVSRYDEKIINVITNTELDGGHGFMTSLPITDTAYIRPVIVVSREAAYIKTDSGAGTKDNPFVIYKKVD